MDSRIAIGVDGARVDLGSVTCHYQTDPFPGGHRYEVEVEDYDFLVLLGDQACGSTDDPPSPDIAKRLLNAFSLLRQLKRASGELRYWLNTVDRLVISKGKVYTKVSMSGVCSPHQNGFENPRIKLDRGGGSTE